MATKWSAEFLERRMAEHRKWRHEVEYAMLEDILDEMQHLPPRKPKSGRLFLELPEHLREPGLRSDHPVNGRVVHG